MLRLKILFIGYTYDNTFYYIHEQDGLPLHMMHNIDDASQRYASSAQFCPHGRKLTSHSPEREISGYHILGTNTDIVPISTLSFCPTKFVARNNILNVMVCLLDIANDAHRIAA